MALPHVIVAHIASFLPNWDNFQLRKTCQAYRYDKHVMHLTEPVHMYRLEAVPAGTLVLFIHFINIGVVTSALPNKGLPLPFISRGGSNLFLMLVCVGMLLSIARRVGETRRTATRSLDLEEIPVLQSS